MSKAHPRYVFRPRSTPADQQRKVRFNSGYGGRKSDSAARDGQGKAAPSDFDGNDAKRRPLPATRSVHASSDAAARGAASGFQSGRLQIAGLDVENFE